MSNMAMFKMKKNSTVFLGGILLSLFQPNASADVEVTEYLDKESGGWAYKASDFAFVAEKNGCRIQWNAIIGKNGESYLSVRRRCNIGFLEQLDLHNAILVKINKKWPLNSFNYINWGRFCIGGDWKWCRPIARASLTSPDYIDYLKNYPNSKQKSVNSIFRELANSSNSYAEFSKLMNKFSVEIELGDVEKVFSAKLNASPFSGEFDQIVQGSNPRVIYNVGTAVFDIVK